MSEKAVYWGVGIFVGVCMAGIAAFVEFVSLPSVGRHAVPASPEVLRIQAESQARAAQLAGEKRKAEQAKQAQLGAFVQKLVDQRIFSKVECSPNTRGVGHVWIPAGSEFWEGEFEGKKQILSAVYAWCFGERDELSVLRLRHSASGKDVGEFSARGLTLD